MVPVARLEENLWESVLSFPHVTLRRRTKVIRLAAHTSTHRILFSALFMFLKIYLIYNIILLMYLCEDMCTWVQVITETKAFPGVKEVVNYTP